MSTSNESEATVSETIENTLQDNPVIAPLYNVTVLSPLDGTELFFYKMNDQSDIVGYSADTGSPLVRRATVWRDGQAIDVSHSEGVTAFDEARDITPAGAILLTSADAVAVLRDNVLTPINTGSIYTDLHDFTLNDNGYVVGAVWRTDNNRRVHVVCAIDPLPPKVLGELWTEPPQTNDRIFLLLNAANQVCSTRPYGPDSMGPLHGFVMEVQTGTQGDGWDLNIPGDAPGYTHCMGIAVNQTGVAVGIIRGDNGDELPFRMRPLVGEQLIPLPYPSHTKGIATDLNDTQLTVGSSWGEDGGPVAWASDGTVTVDLNSRLAPNQGIHLSEARAVNNNGEVACLGTLNNQKMGFLLTPQF